MAPSTLAFDAEPRSLILRTTLDVPQVEARPVSTLDLINSTMQTDAGSMELFPDDASASRAAPVAGFTSRLRRHLVGPLVINLPPKQSPNLRRTCPPLVFVMQQPSPSRH